MRQPRRPRCPREGDFEATGPKVRRIDSSEFIVVLTAPAGGFLRAGTERDGLCCRIARMCFCLAEGVPFDFEVEEIELEALEGYDGDP